MAKLKRYRGASQEAKPKQPTKCKDGNPHRYKRRLKASDKYKHLEEG